MKPEIAAFDLGNVLVNFDFSIAARKLALRSKITAKEFQKIIDQSPLLFRYETGHIAARQFYAEVCSLTGYAGSFDEFGPDFGNIFSPIDEMIALHARLRDQGVPAFIFSNTNDLAVGHIRRHYPFFADFDGYIFSFEHGAMKPNHALYEVVEKVTGRKGAQILYVDDRLENVEAAVERRWQSIHHRTPGETVAQVEQLIPLR